MVSQLLFRFRNYSNFPIICSYGARLRCFPWSLELSNTERPSTLLLLPPQSQNKGNNLFAFFRLSSVFLLLSFNIRPSHPNIIVSCDFAVTIVHQLLRFGPQKSLLLHLKLYQLPFFSNITFMKCLPPLLYFPKIITALIATREMIM